MLRQSGRGVFGEQQDFQERGGGGKEGTMAKEDTVMD